MDVTVIIHRTKHLHVTKIVWCGKVRYYIAVDRGIGYYEDSFKTPDYAIEVCDYLEEIGYWRERMCLL